MLEPGYFLTTELRVRDPHQIQQFRKELQLISLLARQEEGCTLFAVHHDATRPERFVIWERFEDEVAFQHHFAQDYARAYLDCEGLELVRFFQTDLVSLM